MRVLGIMSGTSIDSVDCAICTMGSARVSRVSRCVSPRISFEEHWSVPFPTKLKYQLHRAARNESTTYELGDLVRA